MNDKPEKFETVLKRPIDCTGELLEAFIKLVMQSEEVPINNLTRGVLQAEMLFFTVDKKKAIAGVSAIRFQNALYHQHLFEHAGVPEMYNPYSVESCWLSVKPEYRGQGAAAKLLATMEQVAIDLPISTVYTIARAESFGMNIVFSRAEYTFCGTLHNNTQIAGKLESMNVWHKPVGSA